MAKPSIIDFNASLEKLSIDNEGESTIILKVPLTDLIKIIPLATLTRQLLTVNIEIPEGI